MSSAATLLARTSVSTSVPVDLQFGNSHCVVYFHHCAGEMNSRWHDEVEGIE